MSYYVDNLWELRKARKIFKAKLDIAYRKCDLPEFVYQYCQWIISDGNNPLANMFWLDYNNAINLHQLRKCQSRLHSTASETAKHAFPALSDILPELIPTATAFIGSTANPGKWNYRQFTPFDIINLSSDAIDVADFKEKYMTAPSKVMKAGMSAPEIRIAKACIDNDLPGYAWWWSVWTATKVRGTGRCPRRNCTAGSKNTGSFLKQKIPKGAMYMMYCAIRSGKPQIHPDAPDRILKSRCSLSSAP